MQHRRPKQLGLTMSEILIALALLGLISVMVIPMIIGQRNTAIRSAVLKEAIQVLNQVTEEGIGQDDLFPEGSWTYYSTRLNAASVCNTDAQTEGCWTQAAFAETGQPGLVFHNGATLMGLDNNGAENGNATTDTWGDSAILDWNGSQPPNLEGQDQIKIVIAFGTEPYQGVKPGSVSADPARPDSVTLFNTIYSTNN